LLKIQPFLTYFNFTGAVTPFKLSFGSTFYMIPFFMSYTYIWLYAGQAVASKAED